MTTFADLFSSLKDELAARYRSPVWGTALIVLAAYHWKVFVFFLTEKPNAKDAIAFIEASVSGTSITTAVIIALCYVILFPWIELVVARAASFGKRARNDFQTAEREREIGRRKLIAQQQADLIEIELKNKSERSKLSDIELAKKYQETLSGENFTRWLKDLQNGALNSGLANSIYNYLSKVDTVEGKFFDPKVELAHADFVSDLSTLGSALSGGMSSDMSDARRAELVIFCQKALESQKAYRKVVREQLEV